MSCYQATVVPPWRTEFKLSIEDIPQYCDYRCTHTYKSFTIISTNLLSMHFSIQPHANIFGIFEVRCFIEHVRGVPSKWWWKSVQCFRWRSNIIFGIRESFINSLIQSPQPFSLRYKNKYGKLDFDWWYMTFCILIHLHLIHQIF